MSKKRVLEVILVLLCIIGAFCAIYFPNSEINNEIRDVQNAVIEEIENETEEENNDIVVSEETEELVIQTKEAIESDEDLSTTETITSTESEENTLEEEYLETDGVVEQENISYDGTNTGKGTSLLGSYQGLTYYSQADSRWASVLYTSTNNKTQTIKSSGCRTDFGCNGCI